MEWNKITNITLIYISVGKVLYLLCCSRQRTKIGRIPLSINGSIGGLRSEDSNFLADCTAFNCSTGLELPAFSTNSSKLILGRCLSMSSSSIIQKDNTHINILSCIVCAYNLAEI